MRSSSLVVTIQNLKKEKAFGWKKRMASGTVKGFYRQRKTTKTKSSASKAFSKSNKSGRVAVALGAETAQPLGLISHGGLDLKDDYDEAEEVLRQFDLNMAYGPCLGLTRLARWDRADKLGLNPPKDVEELLRRSNVALECLWDGRI